MEAWQFDRRERWGWRANHLKVDSLALIASAMRSATMGRTERNGHQYVVSVPLRGSGYVKQGEEVAVLRPGQTAAISSPGLPCEMLQSSGFHDLQIAIPGEAIDRAFHALAPVPRPSPLQFATQIDLTQGGGASLLRLLDFIVREAEHPDSGLFAPLIQKQLADAFVMALLIGQPHNFSHLLEPQPRAPAPAYVRRAAEYLEAHAHEHVSIEALAALTGVSARTLFAAFRTHRGQSPMAFLRERRFELARARLLAGSGSTVAEIALACGFEHLGRFSAEYRKRFAESPAATLRRSRDSATAVQSTDHPAARRG
jgi:AraC-like DNA-binding protein